jgi:phosphate transport system ATP-binding protein
MPTIHDIDTGGRQPALEARNLSVSYGETRAVKDISLVVPQNQVVALIGPSGCGKSTLLRCFNRMNDLVPAARVEGEVLFHGQNLYDPEVDPVEVRRRIGMVFQKPNPFPKSHLRQHRLRPAHQRLRKAELDDDRRAIAPPGGALGRGERPAG